MSGFVIRTVATIASGREIVRARAVAGEVLTVGRDPGSDIHLADLAASPHHATLTRTAPATVLAEAAPGLRFSTGGHAIASHAFDARSGGELRIGRQQLTISAEGEDVVVEVRGIADRDAIDHERRFTLASVGPSKRAMSWTAIVLVLALFLAWPISSFFGTRDARAFEPQAALTAGPLSAGHAALSKDCKACHAEPFVAVSDKACARCHTGVHDHADHDRLVAAMAHPGGFAGFKLAVAAALGKDRGRCVDCHSEHEGIKPIAASPQAFCSDCHATLKARLPDTRLGDAGDFAASHPQFAPLVTIEPGARPVQRRISLDAGPREDSALVFPHSLHLASRGAVAQMARSLGRGPVACATCHTPDASRVRFQPVEMERDCGSCHTLDAGRVGGVTRTLRHGDADQAISDALAFGDSHPAPVAAAARRRPGSPGLAPFAGNRGAGAVERLFGRGGTCRECHRVEPGGRFGYRVVPVVQQARFLTGGWFDHDAHTTVKCADCHDATASSDARDLMIPGIATCRTCHGGGEAKAPKVASTCAMCHDYHRSDAAPRAARGRRTAVREPPPLRLAWEG